MIEVVAGVIVRDGRILLAQRPPKGSAGYTWCSPGGKVERGETLHDALLREIREELGAGCEVGSEVIADWSGESSGGACHVTLIPVTLHEDPIPVEFLGLGWFRPVDVRALHAAGALSPANAGAVEQIVAYMKRDRE